MQRCRTEKQWATRTAILSGVQKWEMRIAEMPVVLMHQGVIASQASNSVKQYQRCDADMILTKVLDR
jgi:hypothetical protein